MFSEFCVFLCQHFEIWANVPVTIPWMHELVQCHLNCSSNQCNHLQCKSINYNYCHVKKFHVSLVNQLTARMASSHITSGLFNFLISVCRYKTSSSQRKVGIREAQQVSGRGGTVTSYDIQFILMAADQFIQTQES